LLIQRQPLKFSELKPALRDLVHLFHKTDYGRIWVDFRDGEPVMDPHPRIVRECKLGSDSGQLAEPQSALADFVLKKAVQDFIQQTAAMKHCTVELEIQRGLPFRTRFEV
jgi:hypothetical protein